MKIGIVCPASLPATQFGGILFLAVDLAGELSNEKHQVTRSIYKMKEITFSRELFFNRLKSLLLFPP